MAVEPGNLKYKGPLDSSKMSSDKPQEAIEVPNYLVDKKTQTSYEKGRFLGKVSKFLYTDLLCSNS